MELKFILCKRSQSERKAEASYSYVKPKDREQGINKGSKANLWKEIIHTIELHL